jgi:phage terminase Nu1 subunit (DNA packaging protein)
MLSRGASSRFVPWLQQRSCQSPNKQLERTVKRQRGRAASAAFHHAHAARWKAQHAAAQLRR